MHKQIHCDNKDQDLPLSRTGSSEGTRERWNTGAGLPRSYGWWEGLMALLEKKARPPPGTKACRARPLAMRVSQHTTL